MPWQIRVAIANDTGLIRSLPLNSAWPVGRVRVKCERSGWHFRPSRNRDTIQFAGKQMALAQKHIGTAQRKVESKRAPGIFMSLQASDKKPAAPKIVFLQKPPGTFRITIGTNRHHRMMGDKLLGNSIGQ